VPPLAPRRRFGLALLGWALVFAAGPGVLTAEGSLVLVICSLGAWGSAVVRETGPARWRSRLAEALPAFLGAGAQMAWIVYISAFGLACIAAAHALYALLAGWVARRLAPRLGPAVAVALGWWGVEVVRERTASWVGLVWIQLGHHAHHHPWLVGSARVLGPEGLGLVIALAGGALAALALERRARVRSLAPALVALALAAGLARLVPPPAEVQGPRVLLVQPGFAQERKRFDDPRTNFGASRTLTLEALAREDEPVDLVCWGESMLYVPLMEGVEEALAAGVEAPAWEEPFDPKLVRDFQRLEDDWVRRGLLAELPEGTAFATGAEVYGVRGTPPAIRRLNAVVLYDETGERGPAGVKRHLVPGAETMLGLERYDFVRHFAQDLVGYLPDFFPGETTRVLAFHDRAGKEHRFGATVCFDNAFTDAYVEPLREGRLDFHLVASNEAWYRTGFEMDQMIAFSRLIAIATGRSVVRATNSGVSLVIAPDGREVARVSVEGRDRAVAGTLAAGVPEPAHPASRTPYVVWGRPTIRLLGVAGVVLAFLFAAGDRARRSDRNPRGAGG